MGMKFLNKKGWHTGSLRNIENVWKAEQKHEQEQKKLEELRKQIVEEREKAEFRQLQEQAGLIPRQERLDFLYDSGLSVRSTEGFKALESYPKPAESAAESSTAQQSSTPGALFEEKPQSANDAWRKLHMDPLLMIRQREQEALARIKNNPVKMAMIRRSVEELKKEEDSTDKKKKKKHSERKSSERKHSSRTLHSDEEDDDSEEKGRETDRNHKSAIYEKHNRMRKYGSKSEEEIEERRTRRKDDRGNRGNVNDKDSRQSRDVQRGSEEYRDREREGRGHGYRDPEHRNHQSYDHEARNSDAYSKNERKQDRSVNDKYSSHSRSDSDYGRQDKEPRSSAVARSNDSAARRPESIPPNRRKNAPKLSEEERAAKLREMQLDAEVHEEQRWKRLKKAEEDDAREAAKAAIIKGKNFLDEAKKEVFGAEKGGVTTIEESVRRRAHFRQDRSAADAGNAFRR